MLACEADARGRTGHEDDAYPQAEIFRCACKAAVQVDTSAIASELQAQGKNGEAIGEAIRVARSKAIEQELNRRN